MRSKIPEANGQPKGSRLATGNEQCSQFHRRAVNATSFRTGFMICQSTGRRRHRHTAGAPRSLRTSGRTTEASRSRLSRAGARSIHGSRRQNRASARIWSCRPVAAQAGDKQVDSGFGDFLHRLMHGRQGRPDAAGARAIVKSHQGQVARYAQPMLGRRGHQAQRQEVRGGKDGARRNTWTGAIFLLFANSADDCGAGRPLPGLSYFSSGSIALSSKCASPRSPSTRPGYRVPV